MDRIIAIDDDRLEGLKRLHNLMEDHRATLVSLNLSISSLLLELGVNQFTEDVELDLMRGIIRVKEPKPEDRPAQHGWGEAEAEEPSTEPEPPDQEMVEGTGSGFRDFVSGLSSQLARVEPPVDRQEDDGLLFRKSIEEIREALGPSVFVESEER